MYVIQYPLLRTKKGVPGEKGAPGDKGVPGEDGEVEKAAQLLCRKAGITLIKNPSWMPQEQIVQLRIQAPDQPEKLREVEEAFQEQTGCACRFLC